MAATHSVMFHAPTLTQIYRLLLNLSEQIQCIGFSPEVIVGISRGGWVPARVLSDLLGNANLANVKVECYIDIPTRKEQPRLTQCVSTSVAGARVLVVDEVADSGDSLAIVLKHLKQQGALEIKSAVLYLKTNSAFKPDFHVKETDCWVVFPWEIKETVNVILKCGKANPQLANRQFEALEKAGVPKRLITRFRNKLSEENAC